MKKLDISGHKYGMLTAISIEPPAGRRSVWKFLCECGTIKNIGLEGVRDGRVNSCGCLRKQMLVSRSVKHGHSLNRKESRELKSYNHAKSRCFNKNDAKFPQYGGRGISMCKEWVDSSSQFLIDMGPCPEGHTIDRINPNGNYEPSNCRWANSFQQARTRTDNVIVEFMGQQMVLKDYASLLCLDYKKLHHRVRKLGMSLESATASILDQLCG